MLNEVLVSNSTDIVVRTISGQEHCFQAETYAKAECFVSMINGYALIAAGRSVAQVCLSNPNPLYSRSDLVVQFANANCQFGAHFGVQDRHAATVSHPLNCSHPSCRISLMTDLATGFAC